MLVFFFPSIIAADLQTSLKAPVWYLNYDVTFKASYDSTTRTINGPEHVTISVTQSFSSQEMLDMRSDGPSVYSSMVAGNSVAAPDMQAVLANMENAGNWMPGPAMTADNATDDEISAANDARMKMPIGPAKLEYLRVVVLDSFPDEMGVLHKITRRTTNNRTGDVHPRGSTPFTLEINAKEKKYSLFLTHGFSDLGTPIKWETHELVETKGEAPVETHKSGENSAATVLNGFQIDDPKQVALGMIYIKGDLDPLLDKISGERIISASYQDANERVSGTLAVRYTLSMTKPTKK